MPETIFQLQQQVAEELINLLEDELISIERSGEIAQEVLNVVDEDAPESALGSIKQQLGQIPELKNLNLLDL